jgi:hypothetical protein
MSDTNADQLDDFVSQMGSSSFVSEVQNGAHRTKYQDADKMARLIEALGNVGQLNSATTRTVGTRIRIPTNSQYSNDS